jgi:hypothetical protein
MSRAIALAIATLSLTITIFMSDSTSLTSIAALAVSMAAVLFIDTALIARAIFLKVFLGTNLVAISSVTFLWPMPAGV